MHTTIKNNQYDAQLSKLIPYHSVQDQNKFSNLVAEMTANGWKGAPLVKFGDCLLTGSHRYAAACEVGLESVPVVDLFDVFCVDEDEVLEVVNSMDRWQVDVTELAMDDNHELALELGMDIS